MARKVFLTGVMTLLVCLVEIALLDVFHISLAPERAGPLFIFTALAVVAVTMRSKKPGQ